MAYAVCRVPVAPLRVEAAHKSEMISQLLLAEAGWVLEETTDFIKLQCLHDGYEGWCHRNQLVFTEAWETGGNPQLLTAGWVNPVSINGTPAYVPMGAPVLGEADAKSLSGSLRIDYGSIELWDVGKGLPRLAVDVDAGAGDTVAGTEKTVARPDVKERAMLFRNTSYLWSGRSVFGIDCSGFTQMVYRFFNISLLRDAYLQATQGESVGFLQEARCGDLAFFDNAEGQIIHVGILLNDHEIIHASGDVRVDGIDNAGIVHSDTGMRTHQLRIIKRFFN